MIYLKLFLSFLKIGLFSIGGGYAAMPLIQDEIVAVNAWLTMEEFADVVTIAEMTPGPIAINASSFVGTRVAGVPGALVATFGCILPACVIITLIGLFYEKFMKNRLFGAVLRGLRPAVVGTIAASGATLLMQSFFGTSKFHEIGIPNPVSLVIFAAALFVLLKKKKSPAVTLAMSGALGLLLCPLLQFFR